mgnify:CR=1 FL=1
MANVINSFGNSNVTTEIVSERGYQKVVEIYSEYKAKGLVSPDFPELTVQQLMNKLENFEQAIATSEEGAESLVYNAAISAYKGKMDDKAVELFSKSVENGYKGETAQYYKAVV